MEHRIDDPLDTLFHPDTLVASQWADLHRCHWPTGEQRLALAILRDALLCITRPHGPSGPAANRRIDALLWLQGAQDCYVSFELVCEHLQIEDADGFRKRLFNAISADQLSAKLVKIPVSANGWR